MHFSERASADRADPREMWREQARVLGLSAAGLVPQRHLEDWGITSVQSSRSGESAETVRISRMYTVWRDPDDRQDPSDLRPLDADFLRMSTEAVPDDLPAWMSWMRDRARYPSLWEAVQTHWSSADANRPEPPDVGTKLVHHVDYVLHNRFRAEHGLGHPTEEPWTPLVQRAAVQPTDVVVDSTTVTDGVMIDTDAFVFGIGAPLPDGRSFTAVVPRSLLDLVTLEFIADAPDA